MVAAWKGFHRSSLFGSMKRDDRDFWRNRLVLFAFSAPDRREKPRNSMRTGYLAADFERPERLNRAPECWNSFKMPNTGRLPLFWAAGWPFVWHAIPPSQRDCDSEMIPKPLQAVADKTASTLTFYPVLA
jgi:hypothetical protein